MTMDEAIEKNKPLTDEERQFCELYVYGGSEFAGKKTRCYREVFGNDKVKDIPGASLRLLAKHHILACIKEMVGGERYETETIAVKLQVAETLKAIMEETSTTEFTDRFGITLSPAPLRAVSVNAAKALMDLYPIKHAQETKLRIEGADGNVIFNVIVPQPPVKPEDEDRHQP